MPDTSSPSLPESVPEKPQHDPPQVNWEAVARGLKIIERGSSIFFAAGLCYPAALVLHEIGPELGLKTSRGAIGWLLVLVGFGGLVYNFIGHYVIYSSNPEQGLKGASRASSHCWFLTVLLMGTNVFFLAGSFFSNSEIDLERPSGLFPSLFFLLITVPYGLAGLICFLFVLRRIATLHQNRRLAKQVLIFGIFLGLAATPAWLWLAVVRFQDRWPHSVSVPLSASAALLTGFVVNIWYSYLLVEARRTIEQEETR